MGRPDSAMSLRGFRMHFRPVAHTVLVAAALLIAALPARGQDSFAGVSDEANKKIVKVFGSGGFQGLPAYGSGILVSSDGYVLTVASHLLETPDLRVHLYDGRRFDKVKVVVEEPALDVALLKIENVRDLPYFDVARAAKAPLAKPGDWILAFSNEFEIATRDEPVSVEHGVIAAYSKLHGRKGIFEAPYQGEVYVIDAITNNPGAGGGAVTNRQGELLGLIGKELRNSLTETWVNYAVPIQVLATFVDKAMKGQYKPIARKEPLTGQAGFHGIVLVPNVVERTPPFVEEVLPNSPAARAGLRPDDLIVYIDGEQINSVKAFNDLIDRTPPGTTLRFEVRRFEKEFGTSVERLITMELKLDPPRQRGPGKKR
jgi:serine protease Do